MFSSRDRPLDVAPSYTRGLRWSSCLWESSRNLVKAICFPAGLREGFKNTRRLFLTCPRSTRFPPQSHVMWWAPRKSQTKGVIYIFVRVGGCRNKPMVLALVGFNSRKPRSKSTPFLIYCQNLLYVFNSGRSSTMVLNRLIHPTLTGTSPVQVLPDHIRRRSNPAQTQTAVQVSGVQNKHSLGRVDKYAAHFPVTRPPAQYLTPLAFMPRM